MIGAVAKGALALLIGAAGGAVFFVLGLPLPWTLGSLTAAAIVAIVGGRWLVPGPVRDVARPVVGVLAGSGFTPAILASVGEWWGAAVFVVVYSALITALGFHFFRRVCGLDRATAYFASTPGGLGELTLLGGSLGGNMGALVLIHATRVVAVVFAVPLILQFVLGGSIGRSLPPSQANGAAVLDDWLILIACGVVGLGLAKRFRLPGGVMIAPMILSAVVHGAGWTSVMPPGWLVALVQVMIGSVAGARFAGIRWKEMGNIVWQAAAWSGLLLATATAAALLGASLFDRPFSVLLLSLAPGGLPEMTIISYALGIEIAFVITCHLMRTFSVMTFAPPLFRLTGPLPPPDRPS